VLSKQTKPNDDDDDDDDDVLIHRSPIPVHCEQFVVSGNLW